jgi:hypothetical protein
MNGWFVKLLGLTLLTPALVHESLGFHPGALPRPVAANPAAVSHLRGLPTQLPATPHGTAPGSPYTQRSIFSREQPATPQPRRDSRALNFIRDRMLITPNSGWLGGGSHPLEQVRYGAGALARLRTYRDRFESPDILFNDIDTVYESRGRVPLVARMETLWRQGRNGLRYRINYVDVPGLSRMSDEGLRAFYSNKEIIEPLNKAPQKYWKVYPVFYPGRSAPVEIEFYNAGQNAIDDIAVALRQETFKADGSKGQQLGPMVINGERVTGLKPGERTVVRGSFVVESDGRYRVNLSQLHLVAWERGASKPLVNDTQAGIVDPPKE